MTSVHIENYRPSGTLIDRHFMWWTRNAGSKTNLEAKSIE